MTEPDDDMIVEAERSPAQAAAWAVDRALDTTTDRLAHLRAERDRINAEIRSLVEQHDRLTRMARAGQPKTGASRP